MGILWTIIIGFVAGLIAKFLHPGPNEPAGFIVTNSARNCRSLRCYISGTSRRLVPSWRGRWIDRSNCRRSHSAGDMGDVRTPRSTKRLIEFL